MGGSGIMDNLGYRLPPQDLEAEQCVLGAILLDTNAVYEVLDVIDEDDFYREAHKKIFSGVKRLVGRSEPVDIITLQGELKKMGMLEAVGDISYLSELIGMVPNASNAANYARIVKEKFLERHLLTTCTGIINDIYESGLDTESLLNDAESKIFDVTGGKIQNNFAAIKDLVEQKLNKIMQHTGEFEGVPTGYRDLDDIMSGGLKPGQLAVIAARPSMGKSALALNIAKNAALLYSKKVAIFSLEMTQEEVLNRFLATEAKINVSKVIAGKIEENEWGKFTDAGERLSEAVIFVDDTSGLTPGEIRSKCRRIKSQHGGLDLIVIDYLQMMRSGSSSKSQNREQEVSEISRTLKSIAKELHVPVIALSQLNREADKRSADNKKPQLSDLRESGAIEQDADMIIFIYRDDYYNRDSEWKGVSDIIVSKNRNGRTDSVRLTWLAQYTSFENYVGEQPYELGGYSV